MQHVLNDAADFYFCNIFSSFVDEPLPNSHISVSKFYTDSLFLCFYIHFKKYI